MPRRRDILHNVKEIGYWNFDENRQVFVARRTGTLDFSPEFLRPHRLGYFAIRWLLKGQAVTMVDHVPYEFAPGTMMVANPSQISWFEKAEVPDGFDVRLIVFTREYFDHMPLDTSVAHRLQGTLKHFFHRVDEDEYRIFEKYFDLIEEEYQNLPAESRDPLIAPLIAGLLSRISMVTEDTLAANKSKAYLPLYSAFLDTLEQHFKSLHQVEDYADLLNVNDRKLNRACQAIASTSAGKIIHNRIDFEAKRLLRFGEYTAKEVGYHLGFKDPAHFSKFFKRHNGFPPGQVKLV